LIPQAYLHAWSAKAPWPDLRQVEQDLMICRALCDLFNAPALRGKVAFRGGTAINKLLFQQPLRYSEDIDLVQMQPAPIGRTVDAIRNAPAWLGKCNREQAGHSMHLVFKFAPETDTQSMLINDDDAVAAFECVWTELVVRLKGDRWKLTDKVIAELRGKGYPELLVGHDQR